MKRINQYKKLFEVEGNIDLKKLKLAYRGLVKKWHPDKFQDEDKKLVAEQESLKIIDGYHFLVSIAPETKESNLEEYVNTIAEFHIDDFQHKSMLLEITFTNGVTYEYFGVNKTLYVKLINSPKTNNFAKIKIYNSFLYRKAKKANTVV